MIKLHKHLFNIFTLLSAIGMGVSIYYMVTVPRFFMDGAVLLLVFGLLLLSMVYGKDQRIQIKGEKRKFRVTALNGSYMGVSLLGLILSIYYMIEPNTQLKYGFAAFFGAMFLISMTKSDSSTAGYVLTSIIGLIVSLVFAAQPTDAWGVSDSTWGVTFVAFFAIMLLSAFVSMTYAEPKDFIEAQA